MRVAVTAPAGNVGRHVLAALVRAGLRPLALTRDPDHLDPSLRVRVDAVAVDTRDADAVVAATAGVDALFWVDPPTSAPDPVAESARSGAAAARAVTENRITRTVVQSSLGAERRSGAGALDGLARVEQLLDATGASVLHLRCGFFFTNLLLDLDAVRSGHLEVLLPVDQPMPWVAPRDVAEVAAARLLSTGWSGRQVQGVHGPADLSWRQVAAVVAEATGRPLTVERVPDDVVRGRLRAAGAGPVLVEAVLGMSTGLRDGTAEQPRDAATTTPTHLGGWAHDTLRPLL